MKVRPLAVALAVMATGLPMPLRAADGLYRRSKEIAIASGLGRGFVSNGRENTVSIVDLETLRVTGSVKTRENPRTMTLDPKTHRRRLYVAAAFGAVPAGGGRPPIEAGSFRVVVFELTPGAAR